VEHVKLRPENPSFAYHIDMTGSGNEDEEQIYLRYYADPKSGDDVVGEAFLSQILRRGLFFCSS
jgi:hypothetical protein